MNRSEVRFCSRAPTLRTQRSAPDRESPTSEHIGRRAIHFEELAELVRWPAVFRSSPRVPRACSGRDATWRQTPQGGKRWVLFDRMPYVSCHGGTRFVGVVDSIAYEPAAVRCMYEFSRRFAHNSILPDRRVPESWRALRRKPEMSEKKGTGSG